MREYADIASRAPDVANERWRRSQKKKRAAKLKPAAPPISFGRVQVRLVVIVAGGRMVRR